jgi:hypothetical protein
VKIFHRLLANVVDVETMRSLVGAALPYAARSTSAALRARVQRLLARLDPAALRRQRERDHQGRFLHRTADLSGLMTLSARFADPATGTAAYNYVDAIATAIKAAGDPLGRDIAQLRHDIALDLLTGIDPAQAGCAGPTQRKGTVTVHVNLASLVGLRAGLGQAAPVCAGLGPLCGLGSDEDGDGCSSCRRVLGDLVNEPGEIDGFGPVPAHIARQTVAQLAEVSRWRYAVDDDGRLIAEGALPRELIPGLLDQMSRWSVDATAGPDGRGHYRPTAAQIAFVRARDRRCQAPGCRVPAQKCQIDHRIPWHLGGPTFVDNLYCLCATHHRAKDEAGHRYRRTHAGVEWTTPAGHRYLKEPEHNRKRRRGAMITINPAGLHAA